MADNQAKKEQKKKKAQLRQDKAARAEIRKQNSDKGRSLEEMFMYVDESGNLSSVPPDPSKRKSVDPAQIVFQAGVNRNIPEQAETPRSGKIQYFSQAKGFGFITDTQTGDRIFVHSSEISSPVQEGDAVTFFRQRNQKGFFATQVTIIAD